MQKIINEIDRRVVKLSEQEKKAKTKILKAQYSASQTTLVMLKMWLNEFCKDLTEDEIDAAIDEAYNKAGHNAYFANGFKMGFEFAKTVNNDNTK